MLGEGTGLEDATWPMRQGRIIDPEMATKLAFTALITPCI
jgi:hypothetical protein